MNQCTNRPKRIKERYIGDAIDLVTRWRLNYETRFRQGNGKIVKLSLDQAAEVVGVPRKTLEDYYYQLKNAEKIINLNEIRHEKMGFIRRILKQNKLNQQQMKVQNKEFTETDQFILNDNEILNSFICDDSFELAINQYQQGQLNIMEYKQQQYVIKQQEEGPIAVSQLLCDQQFMQGQYWRQNIFQINRLQSLTPPTPETNDMIMIMSMEDENQTNQQKREE